MRPQRQRECGFDDDIRAAMKLPDACSIKRVAAETTVAEHLRSALSLLSQGDTEDALFYLDRAFTHHRRPVEDFYSRAVQRAGARQRVRQGTRRGLQRNRPLRWGPLEVWRRFGKQRQPSTGSDEQAARGGLWTQGARPGG
jgi:hypothetical protein